MPVSRTSLRTLVSILFANAVLAASAMGGAFSTYADRQDGHLHVLTVAPLPLSPLPQPPPKPRTERIEQSRAQRPDPRPQWNGSGRAERAELRRLRDPDLASRVVPDASRLAFCTEYTKPDSLRIFLFATPHNHRSPPA
jgi:hypothetical protein